MKQTFTFLKKSGAPLGGFFLYIVLSILSVGCVITLAELLRARLAGTPFA